MKKNYKSILLCAFIYALAFFIFEAGSKAQTDTKAPVVEQKATPSAAKPAETKSADAKPVTAATATTSETNAAPAKDAVAAPEPKKTIKKRFSKMYAQFETSMGNFKVLLFHTHVPKTVENFVGLAEGTKEWIDPKTRAPVKQPFYNGLIFHRIIKGFMIQGGDPIGIDPKLGGTGDPGYKFNDEFHSDLKHSKAGMLSMANAGPNTNGSQFFITLAPTPHLDKRHAIFGEVVAADLPVVMKIGEVKTNRANDRPLENVVIKKITITRE
ncbi:MAG: peptidylprolyl isomerase [Bdellovibrionota bacterium]